MNWRKILRSICSVHEHRLLKSKTNEEQKFHSHCQKVQIIERLNKTPNPIRMLLEVFFKIFILRVRAQLACKHIELYLIADVSFPAYTHTYYDVKWQLF